jgi:hypothetical protein
MKRPNAKTSLIGINHQRPASAPVTASMHILKQVRITIKAATR